MMLNAVSSSTYIYIQELMESHRVVQSSDVSRLHYRWCNED